MAFERKLVVAFKIMPRRHKEILNKILKYDADSLELFFSQVKLAKRLKIGLSTLKRALTSFKELGIIKWVFRGVKKTCLYTLSPYFHSKAIRDKFVALVSGFKYIPMALLLSRNAPLFSVHNSVQQQSGPQYIESNIFKSLSLSNIYLKEGGREGERLSESLTACARVSETPLSPLFLPKNKEVEMSYSQSLAIAAASSVKSFVLTDYGRIVVSSYPAEAIAFADQEIVKKVGSTKNTMALFESLLDQYCKEHGVKPNFHRLMQFKEGHPEWRELPKHDPIVISPSSLSEQKTKKSGTSGILPPGMQLPGLEEVSARIKARNAAQAGIESESRIHLEEERQDRRNPATFDRVGEWTKFVLEGKKRKAAGQSVNPFWQREIDAYDAAHVAGADMTLMPMRAVEAMVGRQVADLHSASPEPMHESVSSDEVQPLGSAQMKIISKILEHRDVLGHGESPQLVLTQINDLVSQGASHPLASNGDFWKGMLHVASIIDSQLAMV